MIITVTNQKGGIAKTTTAAALATAWKREGYKVLLIDLDFQSTLTFNLIAENPENLQPTILDVLEGKAAAKDAIIRTEQADIIPANEHLSSFTDKGQERALKDGLADITELYDFIIIDTAPTLSTLYICALTASDRVVIPAQADTANLHALEQLSRTIDTVKRLSNPDIKVAGIVLTRYDHRKVLNREIAEVIKDAAAAAGTRLYDTTIRECIAIAEAQALKQDIYTYAPKSNAAKDYKQLSAEIKAHL